MSEQRFRHGRSHVLGPGSAPEDRRQLLLCPIDGIRIIGEQHQHYPLVGRIHRLQQLLLRGRQFNGLPVHFFLRIDHGITAESKHHGLPGSRQLHRFLQPVFHRLHNKSRAVPALHRPEAAVLTCLYGNAETVGQKHAAVLFWLHMEDFHHEPVHSRILLRRDPSRFLLAVRAAIQPGIHIFARPGTAERVAARSPVLPDKHIRFVAQAQCSVLCHGDSLLPTAENDPVQTVRTGNLSSCQLLHAVQKRRPERRFSAVPVLIPGIAQRADQRQLPGLFFGKRQKTVFVFQKHNRLPGHLPADRTAFSRIQIRLCHPVVGIARLRIIDAKTQSGTERTAQGLIDLLLCQQSQLPGFPCRLLHHHRIVGHGIHTRLHRRSHRLRIGAVVMMQSRHQCRSAAVAHRVYQAVLILKYLLYLVIEHPRRTVYLIVGGHDRFRSALLDSPAERLQIQFVLVAGINGNIFPAPSHFRIVTVKML